ncbi:hypothetical protein QQS21_001098 [Conoideocrella luteorostrata]|uniref:HbrB-like protein n=1 Tax=Conoideocrella luteorostrata TaxID=1105319 RepID=A0AAJ0D0E3_9HYPO|nr:hypothetical protein QQS21_001098 [Conoideocrella luteorostrata]
MQQGQPLSTSTSGRTQMRAPGSFSPLPGPSSPSVDPVRKPSAHNRPPPLRIDSSGSEASIGAPHISVTKSRQRPDSPATPIYNHFSTSHANSSSSNVHQNFSRPGGSSRLITPGPASPLLRNHSRKHSATQGYFDSTLPSTSTSNLSQVSMSTTAGAAAVAAVAVPPTSSVSLSASQIAAQAAVMSHKNGSHARQRSQTVPFPGEGVDGVRRGSGPKMPMSPPILSLTEASAPRDSAFGSVGGQYYDRAAGSHSSAATTAANMVFPRSGHNSPREKSISPQPFPPVPPLPVNIPEKSKLEKSKHKLFSRPGKSSSGKGESKDKNHQSPGKIGSALSALQRGNFSTSSLVEPPASSIYSLNNSSSATIRPAETFSEERVKEKEKKHHFLSRQKQKLKDEYHLQLSSAASNSKPTDPNAPSSLYNFNLPPSPGPSSTFSKAKKDKKMAERSDSRLDTESTFNLPSEWAATGGLPALSQQSTLFDPTDPGKVSTQYNLALDEAWPYLKSKLLVAFEGEDLRLPVEDFNRVVQTHIQWCIHRRSPHSMVDDLRDLLASGFSILDRTLRLTPEDRFIPTVVELWLFTFTSILPYMQSVFLPLDLEVSGCGVIMTPDQSRDFWGGVITSPSSSSNKTAKVAPAASALDVRRLVLTAYRDIVVLPRYETLRTIFSRLSLEFLPSSFANLALGSPPLERVLSTSPSESQSSMARPGTATSIDPCVGSYNSTSTTLLGDGSERGRSRAVSNVSFGSHGSDGPGAIRPYTPSSGLPVLSRVREQNVEDSKQVTDMVGRMLQCMSVLSSVGGVGDTDDEGSKKIEELCKMLKLNWLGRGRTGRNRRGIVGGRVRRDEAREELRVA